MVSHAGLRVVRSNSCKGPVYPGEGPKKSQKAKQIFGPANFLKFGPKGPTWQP